MEEDERLLMDYTRRGDISSLSALVVRNATWMLAFLRGMLRSPSDADDVFQETWMRVIRGGGVYRGGAARAYLMKIARRAAIDFLRKNGRYVPLPDENVVEEYVGADGSADAVPDTAFEVKSTREEMLTAVEALALPEREIVLMRVEGELTFREIADQLGLPIGTVLTRMRSATVRLRKNLRGKGDE